MLFRSDGSAQRNKMRELQGKGKAWFNMNVLFLSLFLFLLDQISKYLVRHNMSLGQSIEIIPNFFNLTYITNDGMAFGINFPFGYYIFTAVSILLTIFLLWYLWSLKDHSIIPRLGLALIIAGAFGNLIDRIFLGEVIDFLDFMIGDFNWYVFNFADSYVTIGMIMVLIDNIFFEKKREQISA